MLSRRVKRVFTLLLSSLIITSPFLFPTKVYAIPTMNLPGYSIKLIATGLGASTGIAIGPSGDIFVADDDGGRIYRIDAITHQVSTYASTGLSFCEDVAFDPIGNLYVASGDGSSRNILKVISDGNYSTIATGSFTVGIKFSKSGSLYMGNSGDGTISKVTSGVKTTFLSGYGGPNGPFGLAFDSAENLYFVQHGTGEIWKSNSTGTIVSKIAQLAPFGSAFVAIDNTGVVFISEPLTGTIRKIINGSTILFASGFAGNPDPPFIGPNGLEFDTHGNLYVADATNLWMITSDVIPDVIPPTVTSTNPIPNATGISINSYLNATFSEFMDASTIGGATFVLTGGGGGILGSISTAYVSGTTVATLIPSAPLSYGATYTATITTGVKDVAGNAMSANYTWSFTTQNAPDTTPPVLSTTTPSNGATNIPIDTPITIVFNEAIDSSSFTPSAFLLTGGGISIPYTINISGSQATITPTANLATNTTYTATVTTSVKDLAGNPLASNYTWTFTTEQIPTPPTTGGGGGGGCSISSEGKSKGESPLGTLLALLSPGILLIGRRVIRQVQNWI